MNATSLPRALAILTAVSVAAACNDTSGPRPTTERGQAGGVSLVPRMATIEAGRVLMLRATLLDEFGDPLAAAFQWRSTNDAVATVAATGEVYGRSAGHAVITASAAGKSQNSTIHVLHREPKQGGEEPKPQLLLRRNR
jgi:uncharacterized protein YjdB